MPSLNQIIFTPLGVIFTLFFLITFFFLQVTQTDRNTLGDFRRYVQALNIVPLNKLLEVLIVLHWSYRHLGNKHHKVVSQLLKLSLGDEAVYPFEETQVTHFRL